ncbi:DNA polymerase-3 subunit delta' [Hymenobacter daecheongensis DSM 21074]|uniref:DNA polymerase-3 subunit delta n=1 Tax=Hymenobacter daecheongensis DSM 21074 TaxID=1121955 RepID=A0A1M6CXZ1_9BACT|nr:DNA polymerase III subunit delta [Hymenobacter daecheongensis]SHI65588.1 DNA polymerase-3 subunit delta' [Hymenobacter daecheongensis DSM 21074]
MRFSEIPNQAAVKQLLRQSVRRQHVAHAQLFRGAEGSAALALALAYATFLNCENRQPEAEDSCGKCASCQKTDKLIHPDLNFIVPVTTTKAVAKEAVSSKFMAEWRGFVLENPYQGLNDWMQHIGAENKQGSISKEESLQLLKLVSLKAFEARFKIVIVWLPELMHPAAANAVLKLLEEPPADTIFLLVSFAPEQLLPTIISRVQPVVVRPYSENDLTAYLRDQHQVPEVKARQLAQLAEGNLGFALAARTAAGSSDNDYFAFFVEWMRQCYGYKVDKLLSQSDEFQKLGRENQKEFLHYALGVLRKVLLFGIDAQFVPHLPAAEQPFVQGFSRFVHRRNADSLTTEINDAHYHIERNANPRMVFVDISLRIAELLQIPA